MNIEILFYFLLAHFIGDFLWQTAYVAKEKEKGLKGLSIHIGLVTGAFLLTISPFLDTIILAAITVNIFSHILIDYFKSKITKLKKYNNLLLYFLDQLSHILIIAGIAFYLKDYKLHINYLENFSSYFEFNVIAFAIGAVLVTYVFDVTRFVVKRECDNSLMYKRDYTGMLIRLGIFSSLFVILIKIV